MSTPSDRSSADRNLLFGILALQMNFIGNDALVAAMHAWVLEKQKPIGQILCEQGKLTAGQLHALEALILEHLKMHDDGSQSSLSSGIPVISLSKLLASIDDNDVQASVSKFSSGSGVDATGSFHSMLTEAGRYRRGVMHKGGGLGEVFFAVDTELPREVALKQIREEKADDRASRMRFKLEAEITGGLEHPGIVPVYGLGVYPDGRPYYAMRFIRGDSLKEAIESFHAAKKPGRNSGEQSLLFRQLLRRYIDVCNAIAYAHSRGVLHRDLKPANIMLGKFGETLVVDWGLAKWGVRDRAAGNDEVEIERTLIPPSGSTDDQTQPGGLLGTIPYMSPEQARGQLTALGPGSDIYSLGSTFYVLLTGKLPYRGNRDEALPKVQKGDFEPIHQTKPGVPPALAAICRKAMSFKPADRYQTALQLAADLDHWLADEPVSAYPEPWIVKAGRWARYHRSWVVGAAVFLVCTVVALSVTTGLVWEEERKTETQRLLAVGEQKKTAEEKLKVIAEQQETEKQRQIAVTNYHMSRKQASDIIKLIEISQFEMASIPALHDRRKELLDTASEACRQFLKQEPEEHELWKLAAQIFRFHANFHRMVYETQEAERSYKDAIALLEKLVETFPAQALEYMLSLSNTLRDHANMQIMRGQLKEATGSVTRSLEIGEALLKIDPRNPNFQRSQALAYILQARIEYREAKKEEMDKPRKTIDRAIDILRQLGRLPQANRNAYDPLHLASALNIKAMIEREDNNFPSSNSAMEAHDEAMKILTGPLVNNANKTGLSDPDVRYYQSMCYVERCNTLARKGAATPNDLLYIGTAINKLHDLQQEFMKIPLYPEAAGHAFLIRGEIRKQSEEYEKAMADFQDSIKLLEPLADKHPHDLAGLHEELGRAHSGFGEIARALGYEKEAISHFRKAASELSKASDLSPIDLRIAGCLREVPK